MCGVTRLGRIGNEYIREEFRSNIAEKMKKYKSKWFGNVEKKK